MWQKAISRVKNVNGHLAVAVDRSGNCSFRYVNDAQGLILLRDEIAGNSVNRVQRFYYVDGKRVGDVGNDGPSRTDYVQAMANRGTNKANYKNWKPVSSADFDQNYEPISPSYPGFAASTYTVKNGDTLQSIARTVWGDADMWYLIADANGLTNSNTLTAGQVLTIPNKVTNIHNNSGTYRVYNPGEAIGDVNPTLPTAPPVPRKKKHGCGGFAMIIVAVVAVVATIATAGALAGPAAIAANGGLLGAGAAALGGAGTIGFAAGALAGAVGSIAGQLAGNALGVQKGFSWGAVATSALTAGLGANGVLPTVGADAKWGQIAANAAIRNTVSQGLNIATGQQKGFSWSSVAASAIAAPITNSLTKGLGSSIGSDLARATTGALVSATTRLVIDGGKIGWAAVAADTLTSFIQSRAASNVVKAPVTRQEQLIKRFNLDPEKNFTDNRFINDMLYMERGGQVSEERRRDMAEFGMRQLGASESEVQTNLSLLNDAKYGLFTQVTNSSAAISTPQLFNQGVSTSSTINLDTISVTPEYALFSNRLDQIAIGTGKLVQDIGAKINNSNRALQYSLEVLDIVGAPVAYAARQAIEGTYIGSQFDEAKQYVFSKASGLFTNVDYDDVRAQNGGLGIFAILSVGASGGAKGLLDDVKVITGRAGKQARLRELAEDSKLGSADRGWIKQEMNSIERGQRSSIRNPPGSDLAHERGREAAKGYDYSNSNLQDRDLHRLQHKYDDFGRANKERPLD